MDPASPTAAESLLGSVFSMAGLVDYQPAAIVSRTLVKKPTGTVTLFAFDKGEALSEHAAPFDVLIYLLEGTVEVALGGQPRQLQAGEALFMPANVPHAVRAMDRCKLLLVMIR